MDLWLNTELGLDVDVALDRNWKGGMAGITVEYASGLFRGIGWKFDDGLEIEFMLNGDEVEFEKRGFCF